LGKKYFKNIDETKGNPLGQIWDDKANQDDIYTSVEMHIVVN
jgi:cytochrome c oxidase subunit 2